MLDFINQFLDYFFYKKCYFCSRKAENGLMCNQCFEQIKSKGSIKTRTINGIKIQGYFYYNFEILKLIRAVKYYNKKELAKSIAQILFDLLKKENFPADKIELIPTPLHECRHKQRKYNQMKLIADEFSKISGCRVNTEIIKRTKNTKPQYNLSQKERKENLKEAFEVFPELYTGKTLVLFDDICTTGATMQEMINKFRENNINNITALVIAFSESKDRA